MRIMPRAKPSWQSPNRNTLRRSNGGFQNTLKAPFVYGHGGGMSGPFPRYAPSGLGLKA